MIGLMVKIYLTWQTLLANNKYSDKKVSEETESDQEPH